jgi:hypothetical protein
MIDRDSRSIEISYRQSNLRPLSARFRSAKLGAIALAIFSVPAFFPERPTRKTAGLIGDRTSSLLKQGE